MAVTTTVTNLVNTTASSIATTIATTTTLATNLTSTNSTTSHTEVTTISTNDTIGLPDSGTIWWSGGVTVTVTPEYGWNYYWYSAYGIYVALFFLLIIFLPTVSILMTIRRRRIAARTAEVTRRQARRRMAVNSGVVETNLTIIPKNMDLPPTYDEVARSGNLNQKSNTAVSTLTITTDLEGSNPDLSAPPAYISQVTETR